jgi:uncharacterized protein (DUF1778 family)
MTPAEPKSKLSLTVYLPAALRHEIEAAAQVAGQTLSTFVTRTLSSALQKEATK